MVKYKNIRVKKRGGGSRLQRVKVLASGKYKFVKNIGSKLRRPRTRSKTRSRKVRRMARRKKRRRGGKSLTQTAFKWIRVGALVAPEAAEIARYGLCYETARTIIQNKTGYNIETGIWDWGHLIKGWGPYLGAVVATYGIPKIASILRRL